jgi:hypothetical protein
MLLSHLKVLKLLTDYFLADALWRKQPARVNITANSWRRLRTKITVRKYSVYTLTPQNAELIRSGDFKRLGLSKAFSCVRICLLTDCLLWVGIFWFHNTFFVIQLRVT